jgi:hypothetical protein
MGRGFFSLLGGGLTALLALLCGAASAQAPVEDEAPVAIDATHTMQPKGFTWVLKDTTNGKEQILILPAFHPTQSKPLLMGDRLAYASITKRGEKSQLGCVTFDLTQGKVLNRQDTDIFVDEGTVPDAQVHRGDDGHVNCRFVGQQCAGKNQEKCSAGEDAVRLSFNGGEQARQGLVMHCKKAKNGRKKVCTPASPGPEASHGKHGSTTKAAKPVKGKATTRAVRKPAKPATSAKSTTHKKGRKS